MEYLDFARIENDNFIQLVVGSFEAGLGKFRPTP
jgi:hypothetical protein